MECCVAGFDPSIEHVKKRPLNGERRIEVTESLATTSATTWRRNFARDNMDIYDSEPPNLHRPATLRKGRQERRDKFLKVKGTCAIASLTNMKYTDYAGSIHAIGHDPFFVHYWTTTQMAVYMDNHDVVYIDATGSLVKKLLLPNGEQSPHIYLYQALVDTGTYKMPVFQMLSAAQNVNAIQYWLFEFLRLGEKQKSGFPLPSTVVCDFDKALLNAIAKAFGQSVSLKAYLSTCYALLLNESGIKVPKCFIRLDICHYMHFLSRWKFFSTLKNPKVKKFYLFALALLTKQTIFARFVELAKSIVILSLSEDVGKDNLGENVPAECARSMITGKIKGLDDSQIPEELLDNDDYTDDDTTLDNCNVVTWAHGVIDECRHTVASSSTGDQLNPYYVPEICNKLKTLLYYFPLYTGVMITVFGYGKVNLSSAPVESEMNDVKHIMLRNESRPMRADKYVATHLLSFDGRAKLAVASQDWAMKNESPQKDTSCSIHSIQESATSSTPIALDDDKGLMNKVPETIPDTDDNHESFSSTTLDVKAITIGEKTSHESSLLVGENHELDIEHNWRDKNPSRGAKRKTYLDACPEFELTSFSKKSRLGLANLENGNMRPSLKLKKYRLVVKNTCGFDSITSILAGACVSGTFQEEISKSDSKFMRFLRNFLQDGCSAKIYKERALLLSEMRQFQSIVENNVWTVDCYSSIGNVAQYMLVNDPSYTERKVCHICSIETIRKSPIVPINVDIIANHGLGRLGEAITDGMPNHKSMCCDQEKETTLTYGSQIVVECDPTELGLKNKCSLADFEKYIQLGEKSFSLAGVVVRYGGQGRRCGHYVGYSFQGTKWLEFDDTKRKIASKSESFPVEPFLIVYALA